MASLKDRIEWLEANRGGQAGARALRTYLHAGETPEERAAAVAALRAVLLARPPSRAPSLTDMLADALESEPCRWPDRSTD